MKWPPANVSFVLKKKAKQKLPLLKANNAKTEKQSGQKYSHFFTVKKAS